ncbi:hypothetical protein GCM10009122_04450 [Fulvivirga kasyanovii]|uniref:DUF5689 domain-containing protein n=1 Tax=Fulvivirga kasyanovii TaxID=396812 RepID=A0ABW9RKH4_9BACT|nr:hypothetical protein [Fulvivirga kasyanovii]MTI24523.1 hypothetical protein [Fulvivirga kasyanovii]
MKHIHILIFYTAIALVGCQKHSHNKDGLLDDQTDIIETEGTQKVDSTGYDSFITYNDSALSIIGVVQTSDITSDSRLGIKADYQLVSSKRDFYLIADTDLTEYWGKCVKVEGYFPSGWDIETEKNGGNWTWGRTAIAVNSITLIQAGDCNALIRQKLKHINLSSYPDTLQGIIVRRQRLAPDISSDYEIVFDEPIENRSDESIQLESMLIYPNINLRTLNRIIDNKMQCTAYGRMVGGYAERMVFETDSIVIQ